MTTNAQPVEQWDIFELSLNGPAAGNPYLDVEFSARFQCGDHVVEADGSYSIEGLSPGHYTMLALITKTRGPDAFNDGVRFATAEVDVVDGETATVDFEMSE